ncbi:hypothetical protein [Acinetobacter guerrae]|uniref:hypothetical protein n=1 Tax=Acinetobacter guerrae TaxID=1843371 RepID=UPI00128B4740|nr:hypothetical protein [Acinetobacter guerrae]MPW44762.1 hypothetical protein [Acinetobacter guerrae]
MKWKMKQRVNQRLRQQRNIQSIIKNSHCPHGYDIACLLCGFGEVDGKRVWHSWAKERDR